MVAGAGTRTPGSPKTEPCPSIVAEVLTPYPTPSPSDAVAFKSVPDVTNHNAVYSGRVAFGLISTGAITSYQITVENTDSDALPIDLQEFRFVSSNDHTKEFGFKGSGFMQESNPDPKSITPGSAATTTVGINSPTTDLVLLWTIRGRLNTIAVPLFAPAPLRITPIQRPGCP